ncbi:TonB-dependent receptor [soil metagenome]
MSPVPSFQRAGRRPSSLYSLTAIAAAALALFHQTDSRAQAAPAAPAAASAPTATLAPVVVTATRVESTPFDIPASIDRVGSDAIRDMKPQINISESLGGVPGLVARDRQNYAQDVQISMRGFGARSTFGIRGLRLYVDGIPATFPDGQGQISNVDLGSVDHFEILRGPFSALYGNSSGGVLQVFTEEGAARPTLDFGVSGGSYGTLRVSTKLSGTSGKLGYVLSASHFETDGYRDHSAATRNIGNVKLTLKPDEDSKITLIANSVSLPKAQDPLGLTRAQYGTNPRGVDPSALQFDTRKTVDQTQGGLIYERRIDSSNSIRALVYTGHRETTQYQAIPVATQTPPLHPGGMIDLASDYSGTDLRWTNRGRLGNAFGNVPYTLIAGVAYDQLDQHRLGFTNFIGTGATAVLGVQGALRRDEDDKASNFDQYVQGSLQLTDALSVNAGVRHSNVRFKSVDKYIVGTNGDDSGSADYSATLPVLGVMYAATDALHFYATAGKGFETPTFNELAYRPNGLTGLNFGLSPAKSKSVEAGVKARIGNAGDLSAAFFETRTTDEIVTLTNTGGRSTYQNAGGTRRNGFEFGWSNTYLTNLRAQAAVTLLDAKYRSAFPTCNVTPCTAANQTIIPAGNLIPGTARKSLYVAAAWAPPVGFRAGVDGRFLSRVQVNDANSDAAPSYFVAGASVGYVALFGSWQVSSFVRGDNLFAKRYVGSVIVNEGNSRFFEPAPGRTWSAGISSQIAF